MTIDVHVIKTRLYTNRTVRRRILRDFGIAGEPPDAVAFADAIIGQFNQKPADDPLGQTLTDHDVFEAAVKARASNNRAWATFLKFERQFADCLGGYDPGDTHRAFAEGRLDLADLKVCLPGQSSTADAAAVRAWADLLHERPNWYDELKGVGRELRQLAAERLGQPLNDSRLVLCLVGLLAGPYPTRHTPSTLVELRRRLLGDRPKLPGMGYVLASEFFRNLHWNAFKPDRHVQRLFDRWLPDAGASVQAKVQSLQGLLGRNTQDLARYLQYSLIGLRATPPGVAYSYTDNLVWLLGAYLEKKGKESDAIYITGGGAPHA